ncbi:thermonuclease family protein [Chelativorans sp. AA-79]|uniref:thermonuclease family protein n=1 Tax=Chelativorans sp. AA-79 TaxID=3028735 RepID=UPI0023F7D30E|nr:thermonuclease family protein [Chelativorans sp. AA-79]WEX12334.1 thermonuclease family protein [Chelativorans sp. AA-79]
MKGQSLRTSAIALLMIALPSPVYTADILRARHPNGAEARSGTFTDASSKITGRASVMDGRTLWFPESGYTVRLASIDACELPQWSYDPHRHRESANPKPVPCGPLAKAWLKRAIGNTKVHCLVQGHPPDRALLGRCTVGNRDLALEMLRVGWARVSSPAPAEYLTWQRYAMSTRHGMWATYVLDMPEWRAKAIDRTLARRPIADFNLLAERASEISPPFEDARKRPRRTDR